MSMRFSLLAASAVLALATTTAFAAPQSSSAGHSTKLGDCSHENAGKTGADYKSAVAACVKGEGVASTKKTSQEKMAECSHAAKGKKGADYKDAVSACMKSH